ncbi:hypothetical protein [Streptomyces noursei]|uniref:Uncharacterized protein n=1 Tax=Streptomyces noursei TaxID=1971 RepID=A0A2N8PGV8_STRNR|nr:hypothetical protein [Streptomyces noursei]PNE40274.1 hypothetical protein AOB60_04650 [Streptomyces noursei]
MSTAPEATQHDDHGQHFHRFLILGKEKLFFYHLALYKDSGHNYQAVFTFEVPVALRDKYLEDLKANENKWVFYSLYCPDHFELPKLKEGKEFNVHLERVLVSDNGDTRTFQTMTENLTKVVCKPTDVLHFRKLGGMDYPDYLTYLVFGEGKEIHIAHQLAQHPNFDEVVTVTPDQTIDPATLKKVPTFVIESIKDPKEAAKESKLKKGQKYQGKINGSSPLIDFTVGRQGWWNRTSLNNT